MRLKLLSALLPPLLVLAGCSTISDLFLPPAPKTVPAELREFTSSAVIRSDWQLDLGKSEAFTFTPAVSGDRVCGAGRNGTLTCAENGREIWRIQIDQTISGGVGADRNLVVIGTIKGDVLAFNAADGKPKWQARASSEILAAPALGEGLVLVRSGDSRVYAFDQADGKRKWVYQRSTPALSLRSNAGVLMAGRGGALAGFPGGKLVAIATSNGAALWEISIAQPKGSTEIERIADITGAPVIDARQTCAVAYQGRIACIDMQNGSTIWGRDLSSSAGLDMDSKAVYVSDDKGTVHAFDRTSGASLWKQTGLAHRGLSRPVVVGKHVVVADAQGYVHALRRDDGAFAARIATDGSAIVADPQLAARGGIVVQTKNGAIYGLKIE